MAQAKFSIKVLSISEPSFTKTPKGGYNQIEVAFKKDGKVEGKKLIDFKYPEVYKFFKGLKGGENVNVTSIKGEDDKFWNWSAATIESGETVDAPAEQESGASEPAVDARAATKSSGATSGRGKVTGSNYETSAERARRQVYIVRQSSISAAIDLLKVNTTPCQTAGGMSGSMTYLPITKEAVKELAKFFEAYVFEQQAAGKLVDLEDDIPF